MKERGIIFNTEMVRAILDGRKTQTRRIVKHQRHSSQEIKLCDDGFFHWSMIGAEKPLSAINYEYGRVGDRLWVRETFNGFWLDDDVIQEIKEGISSASELCDYKADYPDDSKPFEGWTPSTQMPRWASRITLEITGIRVERLQSISEEDAKAEGVIAPDTILSRSVFHLEQWESIHGANTPESWSSNPWVWVIEFKRV